MARKPSVSDNESGLVERYINTAYDTVKLVADNMPAIIFINSEIASGGLDILVDSIDTINTNLALTNANVVTTEANVVLTAADAAATAADVITTAGDVVTLTNLIDDFDDIYLGSKSSDPSLDNDGDPLETGALYFNSVSGVLKVFNGATWIVAVGGLWSPL